MPGLLPSPRMADTTLSYVNAPDITIDEAFVGRSGAVPTIDITAMGVPATTAVDLKADTHPLPTARVDLIDTATGSVVRMIPLFAGTLVTAGLVLDGATTAVGACSVAVSIDGVPVVTAIALSKNSGSAAGTKVTTTVESGGAFTANQVIEFTTTSANTAATFGTVSLGATRA